MDRSGPEMKPVMAKARRAAAPRPGATRAGMKKRKKWM